ncbi:hypothetical protein O4J56_10505 [Nocardiopsis sp. RSe5-2]|uniref:Uncharacterized protein n=1 Tax=Nocardiopsis endophytica TaxID=3018445 RepID=A0ABT4U293_9ACTN|nr:hypothetical protein [Nocardiopsis endophytica]MDA2811067.1 hypothetical protein [Nocardiopsis endophytica]
MRTFGWCSAVVAGGFVVTLVGYTLIGAVAALSAVPPDAAALDGAEPGTGAAGGAATVSGALSAVALAVLTAVAAALGAALARRKGETGTAVSAVVGAFGPLAAVAAALVLFLDGGGLVSAAALHAGAALLGSGVGSVPGARAPR